MVEEQQTTPKAEEEVSSLQKYIGIILGTILAFLAFYVCQLAYDWGLTKWRGIPSDKVLPPPLKGINPVIWQEAVKLAGNGAKMQ